MSTLFLYEINNSFSDDVDIGNAAAAAVMAMFIPGLMSEATRSPSMACQTAAGYLPV